MHTSRRLALPAGIQAMLIRSGRVPAALLAATVACQEQQSDPVLLAPSDASAEATAGQWIMHANMPSDRVNTTVAAVTDAQGRTTLYVVGGRNPSSTAGFCSGGLSKVQ